jgi:hypothetical protein
MKIAPMIASVALAAFLIVVPIGRAQLAAAQELATRPRAVPERVTRPLPSARPKLFLSCPKPCFDSYVRQELTGCHR